jgi:glutamate formiminotransferase/formiminotetrahydrofolate cyclodeaminase
MSVGGVDGTRAATRPLMEIVPNFSEGRRRDVIDAIVAALQVPGVTLVNVQWDPDHNRLDSSLIGPPDAVKRSALAGAAKAIELIDMERHTGGHPRMGAVDVIPFLPVRDVTMEDCIAMAREVGRELAETLAVPVYLYDQAAQTPERASLAAVRKGEYEGLRAAVAAGERLPDFGPHEIGKAGAVAVGARKPLVAFNVYLSGGEDAEDAAKAIAKSVREVSGGLRNVRAIGFYVPERACVTVSMNLVDTEATPIHRALELVRVEAARFGLTVLDTEIVGLAPRASIADAAQHYLQLKGFDPGEQIIEDLVERAGAVAGIEVGGAEEAGIDEAGELPAPAPAAEPTETPPDAPAATALTTPVGGIGDETVSGFLSTVASNAPTPGGGSVAAVTGAAGAALLAMVARLTIGKDDYAGVEPRMLEIAGLADDIRAALLALADRDAAAFDGVMVAFKLPKETDEERAARSEAIQRATADAAAAPLEVARRSASLIDLAPEVIERGNPNAASDGASAAAMLHAAVVAALANVEINAASLKDEEEVVRMRDEAGSLRGKAQELLRTSGAAFRARVGLDTA